MPDTDLEIIGRHSWDECLVRGEKVYRTNASAMSPEDRRTLNGALGRQGITNTQLVPPGQTHNPQFIQFPAEGLENTHPVVRRIMKPHDLRLIGRYNWQPGSFEGIPVMEAKLHDGSAFERSALREALERRGVQSGLNGTNIDNLSIVVPDDRKFQRVLRSAESANGQPNPRPTSGTTSEGLPNDKLSNAKMRLEGIVDPRNMSIVGEELHIKVEPSSSRGPIATALGVDVSKVGRSEYRDHHTVIVALKDMAGGVEAASGIMGKLSMVGRGLLRKLPYVGAVVGVGAVGAVAVSAANKAEAAVRDGSITPGQAARSNDAAVTGAVVDAILPIPTGYDANHHRDELLKMGLPSDVRARLQIGDPTSQIGRVRDRLPQRAESNMSPEMQSFVRLNAEIINYQGQQYANPQLRDLSINLEQQLYVQFDAMRQNPARRQELERLTNVPIDPYETTYTPAPSQSVSGLTTPYPTASPPVPTARIGGSNPSRPPRDTAAPPVQSTVAPLPSSLHIPAAPAAKSYAAAPT